MSDLIKKFSDLNDAWTNAGLTDAPRARHAFAVFCHENAIAIKAGLMLLRLTELHVGTDILEEVANDRGDFDPSKVDPRIMANALASALKAQPLDLEVERRAFEAWVRLDPPAEATVCGGLARSGDGYQAAIAQAAWLAWVARSRKIAT